MDRRKIKQLVQASVTNNQLDRATVMKIAELLTNSELKLYIQGLKAWEKQNTVIIEVPNKSEADLKQFSTLYPGKKIIIEENPDLLLGIRIHDNDDIYEVSLKNTLNQMAEFVAEAYDR